MKPVRNISANRDRPRYAKTVSKLAATAFLIATFLVLVPLAPQQPTIGLDASWGYALNEAVARHLVFGRDFIFTFGPFGSVYTHLYHPATDAMMLVGGTLVAGALCSGFALLAFDRRPWMLALVLLAVLTVTSRDAIFMTLPLLLMMSALVMCSSSDRKLSPIEIALFSTLVCGNGILPLVKASFLAGTALLSLISFIVMVRKGHFRLATYLAVVAAGVMCLAWIWAGQPITTLPGFFIAQAPLISGYTEAMSLHGPFDWIVYWSISATTCLGFFIFSSSRYRCSDRLLVTIGLAAYLFVSFKAGFVRQDLHPRISIGALLFATLTLALILRPRAALVLACIALACWIKLERKVDDMYPRTFIGYASSGFRSTILGFQLRSHPEALQQAFRQANEEIRKRYPLTQVTGSVDIYPTELSPIFAYGMPWSGRPIPQSYSAYTPSLDSLNTTHLLGANAPRTIFFSVMPIDNRLPALEDASSWPVLLNDYRVTGKSGNFIQMAKLDGSEPPEIRRLKETDAELNQLVDVPESTGPVIAAIEIDKTLLGKLTLTTFKLPEIFIETTLESGQITRHRYIPEMGTTGFIVSPYIGSTNDFLLLAAGSADWKRVRQLRIVAPEVGLWRKAIHVRFSTFSISSQPHAYALGVVRASAPFANILDTAPSSPAQCAIDTIDGVAAADHKGNFVVDRQGISLSGWAAPSASRGIGPEEIWIAITAPDGSRRFFKAPIIPRLDVSQFFHQLKMKDSGFDFTLDSKDMSGHYELSVYTTTNSATQICDSKMELTIQ